MKRRFGIIFPLMLGTFMSGIDSSIVNVSLPIMRQEFNCAISQIEWVITAYMLGFCIFMPMTNWLRQRIGFYKLYLISLFIFTAGSLLCGLANTLPMLVAARVLQALGGGAIAPTSMAILTHVFPKSERGNVMGWWALGAITGPALGPTLGGFLTEYFGWPSIFMVNIPIGIIAIVIASFTLRFLQKEHLSVRPHFDGKGFFLFTLFIVLFQYGLARMALEGWSSVPVIVSLVVAILALYIFIRMSTDSPNALFALSLFRHKTFVNCMIITFVRSAALYGGLFLVPFLLQGLLHFSEIESGLVILPNSIAMAILTPIAGTWSDKYGPKKYVVTGLILVSFSMFLFSQVSMPLVWFVLIAMTIRGAGMGLLISPITSTSMNDVLPGEATEASSIYSLMQQLGGSTGVALSGVIHQFLFAFYLTKGNTQPLAEHHAIQDVFVVSMFLVILALIPALKLPVAIIKTKDAEASDIM